MTTIKSNPHTARSAKTAKPKLRSRYLSIFALLTLTAALATIPAMGELAYLKKNTPYIEKVPVKEITSLVNNAHAKIENLLDGNKSTEWVSWQEKLMLEQDYSKNQVFSNRYVDTLKTTSTIGNNVLTLSQIEPTPYGQDGYRKWRQYRLFQDLTLYQDIQYSLKLRYRGTIASNGTNNGVRVFLGEYGTPETEHGSIEDIDVSTEWIEREIKFQKLPKDITNGFCCMQPGSYPGILEVDWAELSYIEHDYVYSFDFTYSDYGLDHYDLNQDQEKINYQFTFDNGWLEATFPDKGYYQFTITPEMRLKPNTTYKVNLEIRGSENRPSVDWWLGGKTSYTPYDSGSTMYYSEDFDECIFTFKTKEVANVDQNGYIDDDIVLKIQSFGKHDRIEIKSVQIYECTTLHNEGKAKIPADDVDNPQYTVNGDDGIIYSYPLAARRKVIVAFGDELKYQQNRKYAVTYNIKYSVDGTVQAELHKTGTVPNPDDNIIGESEVTKIMAGSSQKIRSTATAVQTIGSAGAVVLDLGYNVGDVEVSDLKVYDITTDVSAQNGGTTQKVNEAGQNDFTGNMTTQQITVMEGLKFESDATYTVTVSMKATEPGRLCLKLGDHVYGSQFRTLSYKNFNAKTDGWQDVIFDKVPVPADISAGNPGTLTLQLQTKNGIGDWDTNSNGADNYEGEVTIQAVKIRSYNWIDDEEVFSIRYADVKEEHPYTRFRDGASSYPKVGDGQLIVADWGDKSHNIRIAEEMGDFDQSKTYKIEMTAAASPETKIRVKFGQNGAMAVGYLPLQNSPEFKEFSKIETILNHGDGQYFTNAQNSFFELETRVEAWGSVSPESEIRIKDLRLVSNKNERVVWFTNGSGTATGIDNYDNYKITTGGLVLNPQYNTKTIAENIPLKWGKQYPVSFNINAPAGDYIVSLGDGDVNDSKVITVPGGVTPDADGFVHKELVFNSVPAEAGELTITPMQYTGTISIQNVSISESTPAISEGDIIGTDFITVQLEDGYTMKNDGDYFFHIGYVPFGDGLSNCTPKKFLIQVSTDGTNFRNIGTYEVQDWDNGNAHIGSVNNPVRNIPEGTKYLRFYCMENEGDDYTTAVCFPSETDLNNKTNAYVGQMMRMTRFAIYRQDEIMDPMGTESDTWALPLLTRFQIEANGQQYAYPGARLRDMIGINKSYSNTAELFNFDPRYLTSGYWDTTLPYNKQEGIESEGGMNRDYTADGIDHEKSPYDCIDLLLPDLNKLRTTSNQIYVSMAQAIGTIDNTYPVYRTYENTVDARFLDKSNGFPTEIMYQGFKNNVDGGKDLQGKPIVMNLITYPETVLNDNNYNVANFALTIGEGWDGVRIWCRENVKDLERIHGNKTYSLKGSPDNRYHDVYIESITDTKVEQNTRMMRFAAIQAYAEIPKINLEPDGNVEPYPFELLYNSRENFKNYKWEHTRGIVAGINNDGYVPDGVDWQQIIDANKPDLEKHDIALPNFNFYDSPFDDPYVTVTEADGYTAEYGYNIRNRNRQRTYTILHEIQVLPGERVDLYPQSDIWMTYKDITNNNYDAGTGINYEDQFVRWYDYLTDDAPDYLYFFSEPKSLIKTKDFGFIGGKTLLDHEQRGMGTIASVYFKQSDLNAFNLNPSAHSKYFKKDDNGNTRLKDQWVAADFSLTFNTKLAERLGKDDKTWANKDKNSIDEPIITFRHLFHLISGKSFADDNMADTEGNRKYYQNNRRYLTSFGDKDFMIRLEEDMPDGDNTKSGYYYKVDDGDNVYRRIRGFEIKTYEADRYNETALTYDGTPISAGNLLGTDMFKPIERSKFKHISTDIQTTVQESRWLENGVSFYRAIGCDAPKKGGSYMVRIYGKDADGKIITLPGKGEYPKDEPLVIAEYYITFLDPAKNEASFESEETLKADKYYTHREEYLEGHFNKDGKSSLVVNFDNYTYLKDPKYASDGFFGDKSENVAVKDENGNTLKDEDGKNVTKLQTGSYLKLPIAWDDSNYGFGYTTRGDYNMFVLGDHSIITPYKDAAQAVDNYEGTYDRKYYTSGKTQKGLFYYVNAASDPGDMAKIQFGELCSGSTIYVSAWVNEFNNGQDETANVIFNFYANISKKGDSKVIRQDQIHGFVTGYIDRGTGDFRNGDQGKWMHVYYTFVPDLSLVNYDAGTEEVKSYTLVLENNCISSSGADYAIDDIRAYVVEPRVEARQSTPVCNSKYPNDIEVEVMIPFASLYESMKGTENGGKLQLQYSVMDKQVYDDYVKKHSTQQDVNLNAFAESVLHYPHDNIQMTEGTPKDKPLSWGTIEFYADFKQYFELDEEGQIRKDSKGNPIAKTNTDVGSEGQIIDEEEMLVFKTKLNTEGGYSEFKRNHRDYYIVIGNLGSTGLFQDLVGKDNSDGKYNADVYPSKTGEDGKFIKADWEEYDKVLAQHYDFNSKCVRISDFTLKGASDIIVDGIVYNDVDNITCCENQRPVVQIDLYKMKSETDKEIIKDTPDPDNKLRANPYIDWYYGSYEKFMEETMDEMNSLWEVLIKFRAAYPDATTWDVEPDGEFTTTMKEYLKKMCEPGTKTKDGKTVTTPAKVQLHTSSFIFPELTLKDDFGEPLKDSNNKILTSRDVYVTAIPNDHYQQDDDFGIICTEPTEIKITVTNTSPQMYNGFASDDITYPEEMNVVPLRIGLLHLDNTGVKGGKWIPEKDTNDKDKMTISITKYEGKETLVMPLRDLIVATTGVSVFKRLDGDPYCYLAETNDPNYRQLGQVNYAKPTASTETAVAGTYDSDFGLIPRGVITLDATTATDHFSNVKITFNDDDMKFREGYYYTFKFAYEEDYTTQGVQKPNLAEDIPCSGQTLFTIKVVPEYQVWTGKASLNWNNDENWRRVSGDSDKDVLPSSDGNLSSKPHWKDRYTTGGANENTFSYAPLDFTKVIIPAGATYPQLAARKHDWVVTGEGVSVKNGHGDAVNYVWENAEEDNPDSNAPKAATAAGNGDDKESAADATYENEENELTPSYLPTKYVQYDMAAVMYEVETTTSTEEGISTSTEKTYEPNVYCRPWYANACDQIHFNSNAEILNQQNLDYNKAWVDMEMTPHRWYTVASPLYGVVAGDMYLPSVGTSIPGRQETELFTPITYNNTDKTKNDRFAPAVYQRGWDKGSETVYTIHNTSTEDTESVALASTWSHVYNDVTEEYAPGMGYSVKTDVTRLDNYKESASENDKQSYVKFRFPKADQTYNYFEDGNTTPGELNKDDLPRVAKEQTEADKYYSHRLFEMTGTEQVVRLTKANDGNLFLVGNPFMAHLDMRKFFDKNPTLSKKFWIMSESQQLTGVIDEEGDMILNGTVSQNGDKYKEEGKDNDYSLLAPMQGFFVQALEKDNDGNKVVKTDANGYYINIKFSPDMMAVEPYTATDKKPILKAPAYGTRGDGEDIIRVSTPESTAIIRLSASADKGYAASEDVEMIDDSNQRNIRRVYTVAGTMASAINQTPDADGVEVGLMAPADSLTVVTFNGLALEDYLLYDTTTGEMTQLYDGFELEMEGSVSGRYFLTAGIDTAEIEDGTIRIMPVGHEVVVTAPAVCGELTVRVFDTLGREVAKAEGMEEEVRIALDPGIYAVEVVGTDAGRKSAKLRIR